MHIHKNRKEFGISQVRLIYGDQRRRPGDLMAVNAKGLANVANPLILLVGLPRVELGTNGL